MASAAKQHQSEQETIDAGITINESLSEAVDLKGKTLLGIIIPASWTAAGLSFAVCDTVGGTYVPLYSAAGGGEVAYAASTIVAASRGVTLDPQVFLPWRFVKVRSGTSGAPVVQTAARTLKLLVRPL